MTQTKKLLVLGFGGHARSVADIALTLGIEHLAFIDRNAQEHEHFLGFPVDREWDQFSPQEWCCIPASGNNQQRYLQIQAILAAGYSLATLIAPSSTVGVGAKIAPGCLVGHHAHVGPLAQVGRGCIINTGAIVEHECALGECVHVAVNATIAGRTTLDSNVWIGAGATVIDKVSISADITVGAGGVVIASLSQPGTYVGVPVRRVVDKG